MLPRAHAKTFQVRANMMIKKICKKNLLLRPKATTPIFSHLLFFFVAIGCSNKKMLPKCCPTKKKTFLFRKFFSKILSNVSSDPCHRGVILGWTMYLHHICAFSSQGMCVWMSALTHVIVQININHRATEKEEIFANIAQACISKPGSVV